MKILIVRNMPKMININNYNVQEIGLGKALIAKGHEVGIIFYTDLEYSEVDFNGIKIYYMLAKKLLNHVLYDDKIYDIASNYDIIQCSEYNQIQSYRLAKKYPDKTIIYHGPYYRKLFTTIVNTKIFDIFYLRKYLKLNPKILTKSYLAEEYLKKKGFINVTTVGVGLDDSKFNKKTDISNTDMFNNDYINLVCISSIEKRKNTYFLLNVLNKLVEINPKYRLILIGKPIKSYKDKCLKYISKNNLSNNVLFIDSMKQEELVDVYNNTDVFLLASTYEIFGMVLLEAIYFNVPIVSSLNGGSSYLLSENNIVSEFNVSKWVDKITKMDKNTNYKKDKLCWNELVETFIKEYESKYIK